MRIALVTLRFDAPGGVESNVREIATRLFRRGEEVTVYASDLYNESGWERRTGFASTVNGVPVRRFPARRRLTGINLPLMPGLMDALREDRPSVIHAHSHRYGHVLQAAAVARRTRIPLVVSLHYHPADPGTPPLKRGLLRIQDVGFGGTAYRVARALVVETELEARLVREFAPAGTIRVIPPGIDLARWSEPEAPERPAQLPDRYVLFAGRLAPNKGLSDLLDAYSRIPPRVRPPLVLMGPDWGERARLEQHAQRVGLASELVFLDFVASETAYRTVFRGATAFVLPSQWEAFGIVLLQAMAVGVPIVATAVGGVPEVLEGGRAGQLVPPGNSAALAAAIGSVLSDPQSHAGGVAAGRERVSEFDWDVAVDRHRALYEELGGG